MRFLFGWQGIAVVGFVGIAIGLHLAFSDLVFDGLHRLRRNRPAVRAVKGIARQPSASRMPIEHPDEAA